jgi:hypothetical protein
MLGGPIGVITGVSEIFRGSIGALGLLSVGDCGFLGLLGEFLGLLGEFLPDVLFLVGEFLLEEVFGEFFTGDFFTGEFLLE